MHFHILNELHELLDVTWITKVLYCIALYCTAPRRTTLHCTAPHYTALHYIACHCIVLYIMGEMIYLNEFRMVFRFSEKFALTTCSTTTNGASIRGVTLGTKRSNMASTCENKKLRRHTRKQILTTKLALTN